jgi:hypothetical protein
MKINSFLYSILFLSIVLVKSSSGLWIIDSIRKYFFHSESSREFEPTSKLSPVIFGEFIAKGVITRVIEFERTVFT